MTDAAQIAQRYIDSWNETDATRRADLLTALWTEDARYVDPMMAGEGRAQIDALIAGVHQQFPGLRFALAGKPDGYGAHVRFSWTWVRTAAKAWSRVRTSAFSTTAACAW